MTSNSFSTFKILNIDSEYSEFMLYVPCFHCATDKIFKIIPPQTNPPQTNTFNPKISPSVSRHKIVNKKLLMMEIYELSQQDIHVLEEKLREDKSIVKKRDNVSKPGRFAINFTLKLEN